MGGHAYLEPFPERAAGPIRLVTLAIVLLFVSGSAAHVERLVPDRPVTRVSIPLVFTPSPEGTTTNADYVARTGAASISLSARGSTVRSGGESVAMRLVGGNPAARAIALDPLDARISILRGQDLSRWAIGLPAYQRVRYDDVYPGIDLVYKESEGGLEYDFVVEAGADPSAIALSFPHARRVSIRRDGSLELLVGRSRLVHQAPSIYQLDGRSKSSIVGGFQRHGGSIGFRLGSYDRSAPLVIDPKISIASYFGGSEDDLIRQVVLGDDDSILVAGETGSTDLPLVDPLQGSNTGELDVFVAKFAADGSLVYATYLGGKSTDEVGDLAVDADGNIVIGGSTNSVDFPTKNAFQSSLAGQVYEDGWVAKLAPGGDALVYSTYLGGTEPDQILGLAVDGEGRVVVGGGTNSPRFPANDPNSTFGAAFVARFSADGESLDFVRKVLGFPWPTDVAVDPDGSAVFAGSVFSSFPLSTTPDAAQSQAGGEDDAYLASVTGDGTIVYLTYLGGSHSDFPVAVARDASGNAYVTGGTDSADFPLINPARVTPRWGGEAFVTKVNADGTEFAFSTYLGGGSEDVGTGIAVGADGAPHIVGQTASYDFPVYNEIKADLGGPAEENCSGTPCSDAFVVALDSSGSRFRYATYLGGSGGEKARAIAVDDDGRVVVAGWTMSGDFPSANPAQDTWAGGADAFVMRLDKNLSEPPAVHRPGETPPRPAFEPFWQFPLPTSTQSVAIGDVTGDSRDDLLATTTNFEGSPTWDFRLLVFRQKPDGTLADPIRRRLHASPGAVIDDYGIALADLNGDKRTDVAVATDKGVDIFLQRDGAPAVPTLLATAGRPQQVIAANVLGGSGRDLLVRGRNAIFALVRTRLGFTRTSVAAGSFGEIELGDVTGDGVRDLVAFNRLTVKVFRKKATGTFAPALAYQAKTNYWPLGDGLEIADVTGDGRNDVALTIGGNIPGALVDVFQQSAGGKLMAPRLFHALDVPGPIEAGDVDGDGQLELIVGHGTYSAAGVFQQDSEGMLGPERLYQTVYSSTYSPLGIAVGDLNDDGRLDIAESTGLHQGVVVLLGKP